MSTPSLRFEALGPLRVFGEHELAITRPARRRVLALLLLEGEIGVDQAIDRIWGDDPPGDPRNALQAHVAGVRRQLGGVVESTGDGYRLVLDGHTFDVAEFQERTSRLEAFDPADPERVAAQARGALELWRGRPFPELADDPSARGVIDGLVETRLRVTLTWVDATLAAGRPDDVLSDLGRLVADHPYDERMWERLMLARYRVGDTVGAMRAFQMVRERLGDDLGVEPGPRLRRLEERILQHDPALGAAETVPTPHNLPAVASSFVGRGDDVDRVVRLLAGHRLVTVTGGPGMGKTRLAVEAGRQLLAETPGGVWMARLVGAASRADVMATVSAAMGIAHDVADIDELAETLSVRPQLLVLDNCEHVLDHVRDLVAACLRVEGPLRVLATSRRRLGIAAEHVWRLEPLPLPAGEDDVFESAAARLLIDRAEAADRSFRAREVDAAQLAALSRRTDGIPLAIELAASWIPLLGLREMIDLTVEPSGAAPDLDDHHNSLRAAVDWSLALLSEGDRCLLGAASVFRGPFQLDAFREVCAPESSRIEVAGVASRLAESSLFVPERRRDGSVRYRMLEPVREYAAALLFADCDRDSDEIRDRHARWFLHRATRLGEEIGRETDPAGALAEIDAELVDHRVALRFLLDRGDHESAASLATAMTGYWFSRYLGAEAIRWLDEALEGEIGPPVRVRALWTAGWAAYTRADYAVAGSRFEQSLRTAREVEDLSAVAWAIFGLGRLDLPRDPVRGEERLGHALELFTEVGPERGRGDCLLAIGFSAATRGDVSVAQPLLTEALEVMERCGSLRSQSICHRYLSMTAWQEGRRDPALSHADAAERLARRSDDRPAIGGALIQRALVEARWGSMSQAAEAVFEAVDQLPARHEIDHCLVLVGAFDILFGSGHVEMGSRLLAHIDRVFSDFGWVPIDQRMPQAAERWRAAARPVFGAERVTSAEMARQVREVLAPLLG